jgi:hypothetical protein
VATPKKTVPSNQTPAVNANPVFPVSCQQQEINRVAQKIVRDRGIAILATPVVFTNLFADYSSSNLSEERKALQKALQKGIHHHYLNDRKEFVVNAANVNNARNALNAMAMNPKDIEMITETFSAIGKVA